MLSSPESVYLASYRAGYQKQQRLDWRRWQSKKTKSPPLPPSFLRRNSLSNIVNALRKVNH